MRIAALSLSALLALIAAGFAQERSAKLKVGVFGRPPLANSRPRIGAMVLGRHHDNCRVWRQDATDRDGPFPGLPLDVSWHSARKRFHRIRIFEYYACTAQRLDKRVRRPDTFPKWCHACV